MSSAIRGFGFGLSSSLKEEAIVSTKMQGIVSILGTDCERVKISPNSLRRTLSADMSSRKWLSQHGFPPLKKIASSEQFPVSITEYSSSSSSSSSSDSEEEDYDHEHRDNNNNKPQFEVENPSQFDIWSSIIQQKKQEESNLLPPPYVHPLVRRSASSLNEKSLQICTESLGSETGSEGFSSYPPSQTSDAEEDKEEQQQQQPEVVNTNNYDVEEWNVVKYNNLAAATKKATPISFPPPISSLSSRRYGTSMQMKSHRDNGRLVLEAVFVSSQNNFRAERQDGRLVLTLINGPKEEEEVGAKKENEVDQFEVELEGSEDEKEHEDEDDETEEEEEEEEEEERCLGEVGGCGGGEVQFVMEQAPKLSGGIIDVHRLATMVDKTIVLANKNPTWSNQAKFEEELEEVVKPIAAMTQSLPPRPPVARIIPSAPKMVATATATKPGAVSFNPYEYYWKPKTALSKTPATTLSKTLNPNTQKAMLLTKNNNNNRNQLNKMLYIVQNCKEQRRSLLYQDSVCIATS